MIVVIGGGIGGLAAALALQRAGFGVRVFERTPELREVGAGIGLWANAQHALTKLGVAAEVDALAVRTHAGLMSWDGRQLVHGVEPGSDAVVVHRAELHRILFSALQPGTVTLDARCVGVEDQGARAVARFADGTEVAGDVLIGADGLHSVVRSALFGEQPPVYAGYASWRAVARFDPARLRPGESWGAGQRFGCFPMHGGWVYWFAAKNTAEGARSPDGEFQEMRRSFRGWHSPIPELIEATEPGAILRNDTYDRPPLRTWSSGRITLLGDAAHPMTPNLGQGACQAIEDAVVLAQALGQSTPLGAALRDYESKRVARTNLIVRRSRQAGAVAQWSNPLAVRLRNALVQALGPRMQARSLRPIVGHRV